MEASNQVSSLAAYVGLLPLFYDPGFQLYQQLTYTADTSVLLRGLGGGGWDELGDWD